VIYPRIYGLARHFPNITRWFLDAFTPPLRGDRLSAGDTKSLPR
jgi:hypothetical protein